MTDRIKALTVVLEDDTRDDDCQPLIDAIRQMRGVLTVRTQVTNSLDDYVAEQRVRRRLLDQILNIVEAR